MTISWGKNVNLWVDRSRLSCSRCIKLEKATANVVAQEKRAIVLHYSYYVTLSTTLEDQKNKQNQI